MERTVHTEIPFKTQAIFQVSKISEEGVCLKSDKQKVDIYFHSPTIAVRILSSLIILKTLARGETTASISATFVCLFLSIFFFTHCNLGSVCYTSDHGL